MFFIFVYGYIFGIILNGPLKGVIMFIILRSMVKRYYYVLCIFVCNECSGVECRGLKNWYKYFLLLLFESRIPYTPYTPYTLELYIIIISIISSINNITNNNNKLKIKNKPNTNPTPTLHTYKKNKLITKYINI
jgi:hypothetical protein